MYWVDFMVIICAKYGLVGGQKQGSVWSIYEDLWAKIWAKMAGTFCAENFAEPASIAERMPK